MAVMLATLISPAIAIPLSPASQLAKAKGQQTQAPNPAAPVAPSDVIPPTAPSPLVATRVEAATPVALPDAAEAALLPVAEDEPVFELLEKVPAMATEALFVPQVAAPVARSVGYRYGFDTPAPNLFMQQPATPAPSQAPRLRAVGFPDDRNATPAIPEAELLTVLTDVVKRDSDPNVRAEALRGIYRFRSDAAINTLLSLYDSIPDIKTKGEVLNYLMRSEGDNSKAIAKLMSIAKTEKDETLKSRAFSQLAKVKGDEGATNLIQIYDTLQDPKEKQLVIRYLGINKSRKAADKLIQIAKNDADPNVRQSAIRSLYAIDNRLYLDLRERGLSPVNKVSEAWRIEDLDKIKAEWDHASLLVDHEAIERSMEEAKRHFEELQFQFQLKPEFKVAPEVKVVPRIK